MVPTDERKRARKVRFLLSRGFSHSVVFKVLKGGIEDEFGEATD